MKRIILICLALLFLIGCAAEGQASASNPKPESGPWSVVEPTPEPSSTPEESPQPSQSEEASDLKAGETPNPDGQEPSGEEDHPGDTELKNKMTRLGYAVQDWFYTKMPESCYNYYNLSHDGENFILKVGVTDEAAVDEGLAPWTGEKWDRLVKEPARFSRAELGELAEAINTLDLGPVVKINAYVQPSDSYEEIGVLVLLTPKDPEAPPPEDTARWDKLPKEVEDLAEEYGIPMDLITYRPPVF